ncbi:unannotated protein [freshwater metagenome]|uniref:Unannotated protein n=2 Tax=freshwater metagenome TaxID=449393 RepID=A0A6J6F149_9ZZZZ
MACISLPTPTAPLMSNSVDDVTVVSPKSRNSIIAALHALSTKPSIWFEPTTGRSLTPCATEVSPGLIDILAIPIAPITCSAFIIRTLVIR